MTITLFIQCTFSSLWSAMDQNGKEIVGWIPGCSFQACIWIRYAKETARHRALFLSFPDEKFGRLVTNLIHFSAKRETTVIGEGPALISQKCIRLSIQHAFSPTSRLFQALSLDLAAEICTFGRQFGTKWARNGLNTPLLACSLASLVG